MYNLSSLWEHTTHIPCVVSGTVDLTQSNLIVRLYVLIHNLGTSTDYTWFMHKNANFASHKVINLVIRIIRLQAYATN